MKPSLGKGIMAAVLLFGLTACSSAQTSAGKPIVQTEKSGHAQVKWEVFNSVNWSKKSKGLQVKITKVAVTNSIPNYEMANQKTPAVKVTFSIRNDSSNPFKVNPDEALLVTPPGKHTKPDMHISDELKGEIKPGETKTGTVGFYLKPNRKLSKLKWVELKLPAEKILPDKVQDQEIDTGQIKIRPN